MRRRKRDRPVEAVLIKSPAASPEEGMIQIAGTCVMEFRVAVR
jgi:hypothetical protein